MRPTKIDYNPTHHAVVDALRNEDGAVVNKPLNKKIEPRRPKAMPHTSGDVIITRKPVGRWKCDTCPSKGRGMTTMLEHSSDFNHRSYTEV